MRKILTSAILIVSLATGAQAMAAAKPAAKAKAAAAAPADPKAADCAKQWAAEKKHTQTRKAFMAACTKA